MDSYNNFIEDNYASESLFNPEIKTADLLDAVRSKIETTVKTVDQAVSLENRLSEEAAKFNDCLNTIMNAARKYERGEIEKADMLEECKPCVNALKNECMALSLSNINVDSEDISEEEIAMLREYIVGCKDIVAERKKFLQDCGDCTMEGDMDSMDNYDIAMEANVFSTLRKSNDAKTAAMLYKQAKQMWGLGDKEKAKKALAQSKKLYEKCLAAAKKLAKVYKADVTTGTIVNKKKDTQVKNETFRKNKELTDSTKGASVIKYFEDRVDACTALKMQWENKAGKSTLKETKKQLQYERYQKRAGNKATSKAKKSANKYARNYKEPDQGAVEGAVEVDNDTLFGLVSACESLLDSMELEEVIAMEAAGEEDGGMSEDNADVARLKELAVELKRAQNNNDAATAKSVSAEMDKVLAKIQKDTEAAYTMDDYEAQKAAERKAIKTGAIIAGVIAAIGAGAYVGNKKGVFAKVSNNLREAAERVRTKQKKTGKASPEGKTLAKSAKNAWNGVRGFVANIGKKAPKAEPSTDSFLSTLMIDDAMESFDDDDLFDFEDAMESFDDDDLFDFEDAMESFDEYDSEFSDELDDIAMEAAIELMAIEDGVWDEDEF